MIKLASILLLNLNLLSLSFFAHADQPISSVATNDFLAQLSIKQGKGTFSQDKHFSFLSQPIRSNGHFVARQQSALWQTEQPIFSQLLLTPTAIYQRQSVKDDFQILVENGDLTTVLATIITGQINHNDWNINELVSPSSVNSSDKNIEKHCLLLTPKSSFLKQLFQQVSLCLLAEKQSAEQQENKHSSRQIILIDQQGNKTDIIMQLLDKELSSDDINSLTTHAIKPQEVVPTTGSKLETTQ